MTCVRLGDEFGTILTVGGPSLLIQVDSDEYQFEWHSYLGPMPESKNGVAITRARKNFYLAISLWSEQGNRIVDGRCIWDPVIEPEYLHVVGSIWVQASSADSMMQTLRNKGIVGCFAHSVGGCTDCAHPKLPRRRRR